MCVCVCVCVRERERERERENLFFKYLTQSEFSVKIAEDCRFERVHAESSIIKE